ncbi:MAG: AAA family ATPase [Pirellulaceae bacterium]
MRVGLTLGKFAPLHQGHQRVIEAAIAETQHQIVVIYDVPDVTDIPLRVRANWIEQLYPQVEVILAWDGPTEVSHDPVVTRQHDEYLQRLLRGKGVTHFYSSEFYGEHVSLALGAIDRRIDDQRVNVSISGTQIRADPYRYRNFLSPIVYWDMVKKAVFLGAPATGKSTLAAYMAKRHATVWMPEYGREYWEEHQVNRRLSQEQLLAIAVEHRRREMSLVMQARRYFFIDTDASTTCQFSHYYHGSALAELQRLANDCCKRYDLFFLCDTDIAYDDTPDRSGEVQREEFQREIIASLKSLGTNTHLLRGSLEDRAQQVDQILIDPASTARRG